MMLTIVCITMGRRASLTRIAVPFCRFHRCFNATEGKQHGKCATAGDIHPARDGIGLMIGPARWRVRRRGHHVLAFPEGAAPAGADAATAGEGLPAAGPDRRVVHVGVGLAMFFAFANRR
jgi:hypothetical protein